jgi:hypothetical protein
MPMSVAKVFYEAIVGIVAQFSGNQKLSIA